MAPLVRLLHVAPGDNTKVGARVARFVPEGRTQVMLAALDNQESITALLPETLVPKEVMKAADAGSPDRHHAVALKVVALEGRGGSEGAIGAGVGHQYPAEGQGADVPGSGVVQVHLGTAGADAQVAAAQGVRAVALQGAGRDAWSVRCSCWCRKGSSRDRRHVLFTPPTPLMSPLR